MKKKTPAVCMRCAFHWNAKQVLDCRCPKCGLLGRIDTAHPDIQVVLNCKPLVARPGQLALPFKK